MRKIISDSSWNVNSETPLVVNSHETFTGAEDGGQVSNTWPDYPRPNAALGRQPNVWLNVQQPNDDGIDRQSLHCKVDNNAAEKRVFDPGNLARGVVP